jgi:hypothetical protein
MSYVIVIAAVLFIVYFYNKNKESPKSEKPSEKKPLEENPLESKGFSVKAEDFLRLIGASKQEIRNILPPYFELKGDAWSALTNPPYPGSLFDFVDSIEMISTTKKSVIFNTNNKEVFAKYANSIAELGFEDMPGHILRYGEHLYEEISGSRSPLNSQHSVLIRGKNVYTLSLHHSLFWRNSGTTVYSLSIMKLE